MRDPVRAAAVLSICMLAGACGGPSELSEQGGGAVLTEEHPEAIRTPGWIQFGPDLSLHVASEADPPREPYVRGWIIGGLFLPDGEVVGILTEPPPKRILSRGRLHLETRAFTPEKSERLARAPYVDGWHDEETGGFFPSSGVHWEPPVTGGSD